MPINKAKYFELIGYKPHPAQLHFHNSDARFRVPCCGRRFGKSLMAGRDLEPHLVMPEKRMYWIVGPTYDLGEKEFRVVWDDLIVKQGLGKDKRVKKAWNKKQGDMFIELPWGARVEVRSAQHPENLVGESLSGVIMSEAAKHDFETWDRFIRPALLDMRGWAIFPSTPEGRNWYYDQWKSGQDPNDLEFDSWRFPSWENTTIFPDGRNDAEILSMEKKATPEWFMQEIGADFTSFVGKIYSEFDFTEHVIDYTFHPEWRNYLFCDWGFTNPMAAIEVQIDPQDNIYVWREHYETGLIMQEHIARMKNRDQPQGYHLDMATGDAADPEAVATMSQYMVPTLALPEAKTNWRAGIDLVKSFLQPQLHHYDEHERPVYKPKLFVDRSCSNVIREFENYRVKKASKDANFAEQARKMDDHAMDAIRYGLVHLYQLGAQYHLTDVVTPNQTHNIGDTFFQGSGDSIFTSGVNF